MSKELATGYEFKETLRDQFNQKLDFQSGEKLLFIKVTQVEVCKFKALQAFAKTLRNWWTQILIYFTGGYNHSFTEGANLKIKVPNRCGYGDRSFNSFQLHIPISFG